MRTIKLILIAFMTFCCIAINAQVETEEQVKEKAEELFKDEQYVQATPYYLRLISLQPKSAEYNYRYGACLLYNANKRGEAIRYLKFATAQAEVDAKAHFFMGRAYHLNYLFTDAVTSYRLFLAQATSRDKNKYDAEHHMQMAQNGLQLLSKYSELIVFEKREIEAEKFFRLYDLSEIGGDLLVTSEFQSKVDIRKYHVPLIHFAPKAQTIYYSSYGDLGNNGKDIYMRKRFVGGGWGDPILVQGGVNTPYDEDFPSISADGQYLYFSSKGHNSMGGYDIFRCKIDPRTGEFGKAENLDFSISSPDDDVLFLTDKNNENGYFASARDSEVGKYNVYKIKVDPIPVNLRILAGVFSSSINPQTAQLEIKVTSGSTGREVGTFTGQSGTQMVITVPESGAYSYEMSIIGSSEVFVENVFVPKSESLKPMQQNFRHYYKDGIEKIELSNEFEKTVKNAEELLAATFANEAKLKPNADEIDKEVLDEFKARREILAAVGAEDQELDDFAAGLIRKIEMMLKNMELANGFESKIVFQMDLLLPELESAVDQLNSLSEKYSTFKGGSQRLNGVQRAQVLMAKRDQNVSTFNRYRDLNESIQSKQASKSPLVYEEWNKLATELFAMAEGDRREEAIAFIEKHKADFEQMVKQDRTDFQQESSARLDQIDQKIVQVKKDKFNYQTALSKVQNQRQVLEQKMAKAKKKEKESLENDLASIKRQEAMLRDEIAILGKETVDLTLERNALVNNLSDFNKFSSIEAQVSDRRLLDVVSDFRAIMNKKSGSKLDDLESDVALFESEGSSAFDDTEKQEVRTHERELKARLSEIHPKYEVEYKKVQQNTSWTVLESTEEFIKIEKENIQFLENELSTIEEKFDEKEQDEEIFEQKTVLKELIEESKKRLANFERDLEIAQNLSVDGMIALLDKNYPKRVQRIKGDVEKSELERLESLNEEDEKLLQKVEKRKKELEAAIKAGGTNVEQLQAELDIILELESRLNQQIAKRDRQISDLKLAETVVQEVGEKDEKKEGRTIISNDFGAISELEEGYSKLTPEQRNERFKLLVASELYEELENLEESADNKRKREVQELLTAYLQDNEVEILLAASDLNNADKKAFINDYDKAKKQAESTLLSMRKKEKETYVDFDASQEVSDLVEMDGLDMSVLDRDAINQVFGDYAVNRKKILAKNLSAKQELRELIALEDGYINYANDEIAMLKEKLKKKDSDLTKEQLRLYDEAREVLKNQKKLEQFEYRLLPESSEEIAERLYPEYNEQILAIDEDKSMTNREKAFAYNALDQTLLERSQADLSDFSALAPLYPDRKEIIAKEKEVNTFLNATRKRILLRDTGEEIVSENPMDKNPENQNERVQIKSVEALKDATLEDIREEILKGKANPIEKEINSMQEARENMVDLQRYRDDLVNYAVVLDANKSSEAQKVYREIEAIDLKTDKMSIDIEYEEKLERLSEKNQTLLALSAKDSSIIKLEIQEGISKAALLDPNLSKKDQKGLTQDLQSTREKRFNEESLAIEKEIAAIKSSNTETYEKLKGLDMISSSSQNNFALAKTHFENLEKIGDYYQQEAQKEKESGEKYSKLVKALNQHQLAEEVLEMVYIDNKVESESASALTTIDLASELRSQKQGVQVQLASIEAEIADVEQAIQKSDKPASSVELRQKRRELAMKKELYLDLQRNVDRKLDIAPDKLPKTIDRRARNVQLTEEEEKEIAKTAEYQKLYRLTNEALFLEGEIITKEVALNELKEEVKTIIQFDLDAPSERNRINIKTGVLTILEEEKNFKDLQNRLKNAQLQIDEAMPSEPEKYYKIQNMVLRDVVSTYRDPKASPLVNMEIPKTGLEVDMSKSGKTKSIDSTTPPPIVTNTLPAGLLYRVQLGAFSKEIEVNAFEEFHPVTGEKREDGLVTYMAGYFDENKKARQAQRMIRNIGYKDAFVVAYCDGKRITLREAKRLEQTQACAPFSIEDMVEGRVEYIESEQAKAYQQNAADVNGLFFTVQVGVYNTIVGADRMKGLQDVVTQRLPNGYVRYATGKFATVDEAKAHKELAKELGFADAFVTAFYQGERITIKKAYEIMEQQGPEVITKTVEKPIEKKEDSRIFNPQRPWRGKRSEVFEPELPGENAVNENAFPTDTVFEAVTPDDFGLAELYTKKEKAPIGMQFVSKKTYYTFPREVLDRYRKYGDFYYDAESNRIKSGLYENKVDMPNVYYLRSEVDTLFTLVDSDWLTMKNQQVKNVIVRLNGSEVSGDFANLMMSTQVEKKTRKVNGRIEVLFIAVPSSEVTALKDKCRMLGVHVSEQAFFVP